MAGLPRVADSRQPREAWDIFVEGGFERLTTALMKGDPFSERGLNQMKRLANRYGAFVNALDARTKPLERKDD